jgi:hypothetical protein
VLHGKVLAPRSYTGIVRIGSQLDETGFEMPLNTIRKPHSLEDTREIVRTVLNAGADYVIFYDGAMPFEWYKAGVEEAHKMGKPAFMRAYGPGIFPTQAAEIGAAQLPHSAGIPLAVAKNPSQFRQGRDDRNELDKYADMDDAKAADLIKTLVAHHVALVPAEAMESALAAYTEIDQGAVRERRLKGWENVKRFHKMFVDAGGHLCVSGNLNDRYVPGLELFQEMRIMTEVGLTPMQIIQGSTKCAAELVQKQDSLGTVEAGKIADILIVSADPLKDIENLKKTDTVIFDGKVIDRSYHGNYSTTFNPPGDQPSPAVEGLPWVVALMKVGRGGGAAAGGEGRGAAAPVADPASSPQPAIQKFDPYIVTQSTPSSTTSSTATVTVKGINFVRRSIVHFKGKPVPTQVVSPTEIRFTLDTEALRTPGRFEFVVVNPAPVAPLFTRGMWGNGTSNMAHLIVNYKY